MAGIPAHGQIDHEDPVVLAGIGGEQRRAGAPIVERPSDRRSEALGAARAQNIDVRIDLADGRILEDGDAGRVVVSEDDGTRMRATRL